MHLTIPSEELHKVLKATSVFRDEAIIQFKKQGMMLRVQDESGTGLYNTLIPESSMSSYERGEYSRLGIHVEDMLNFIPKIEDDITLELESSGTNKFMMSVGSREFRAPAIDPEYVKGEPEMVPNLDMPIKVKMDPDSLLNFVSDTYSHVFNETEDAHYFIEVREGAMHLWSKRDDYELYEWFHMEDFDDYSIDWDATSPAKSENMPGNPSEEHKAVTIMSSALTKDIMLFSDIARLEIGHGMPLKMVSETENGVKHSWIVPPRFPTQGGTTEIPERVINERTVV